MIVKTDTGERDVPITEVTPQNYIVPERERGEYHCIVEVRKFDSETGRRLSIPRIQKFGQKTFETVVLPNLKKQGYTIEILYNPTEYLKQRAKARAHQYRTRYSAHSPSKPQNSKPSKMNSSQPQSIRLSRHVVKRNRLC